MFKCSAIFYNLAKTSEKYSAVDVVWFQHLTNMCLPPDTLLLSLKEIRSLSVQETQIRLRTAQSDLSFLNAYDIISFSCVFLSMFTYIERY